MSDAPHVVSIAAQMSFWMPVSVMVASTIPRTPSVASINRVVSITGPSRSLVTRMTYLCGTKLQYNSIGARTARKASFITFANNSQTSRDIAEGHAGV